MPLPTNTLRSRATVDDPSLRLNRERIHRFITQSERWLNDDYVDGVVGPCPWSLKP
jgi:hypothetical protein